jgi:pimeloyl-ACP methyl ester carboxylesterase
MSRMKTLIQILLGLTCFLSAGGAAHATAVSPPAGGLRIDCRGQPSGAPTVILESGAFGTADDWEFVLDDLAAGGRVCAYDRAGVGLSSPGDGREDVVSIARELAGVLDQIHETGPAILVGHSNGALYIETFAALYPGRVAGMVYVNGVNSNDLYDPVLVHDLDAERRLSNLAVIVADIGLAPLLAPIVVHAEGLTGEAAKRKRRALTSLHSLRVSRNEDRAIVPGLRVTRDLGTPSAAIPTVVIVGEPYPKEKMARHWRAAEIVPADHAERSWVLDAVGASHTSPLARDRAYVRAAVDWLRGPYSAAPTPSAGGAQTSQALETWRRRK